MSSWKNVRTFFKEHLFSEIKTNLHIIFNTNWHIICSLNIFYYNTKNLEFQNNCLLQKILKKTFISIFSLVSHSFNTDTDH